MATTRPVPAPDSPDRESAASPFHENRSLFSDHYLTERLPEREEWREEVGDALRAARELYEGKRGILDGLNEAQTEAYGLTPEEMELLWETAPPRMPAGRERTAEKAEFDGRDRPERGGSG